MRLQYILLAGFAAVAAVPIAVLAFWPLTKPLENEVQQVAEKHLLVARHIGHALKRYHRDAISVFEMVAANAETAPSGATLRLLRDLHFRHLCVIRIDDGAILRTICPDSDSCPNSIHPKRLSYLLTIAAAGGTVFSPVMRGVSGRPTIYIVRRAGDRLFVGAISTQYFVALGRAVAFGRKGHAAIVDQNGTVLAHPKPAWLASLKNIAKVKPVKAMMEGKTGITMFFSPAMKADMIAGYTAIPGPGWGAMVPQPFSELEERAVSIRDQARSAIMAGVLLAILLAGLLASRISRPLSQVSAAAKRMLSGEYSARAAEPPRGTPSELRQLGDVFNKMASKLERSHNNLGEMVARRTEQLAKSERKLRRAKEDAEAASEAKSAFLAQMSHELRTPLNAILGYTEVMSRELLGPVGSPKYREYLQHVHHSGAHLRDVIGDILDASKLGSGKLTLTQEEVPLGEVVDTAIIHAAPVADKADINIVRMLHENLPVVWGDRTRLIQILDNVISNAVKFTPNGGTVSVAAGQALDGSIVIKVRDTGVGIAEEDLPRIAEPFVQSANGLRNPTEGAGLGVSIATALAEAHGGSLTYRSHQGTGTLATLELPAARIVEQVNAA